MKFPVQIRLKSLIKINSFVLVSCCFFAHLFSCSVQNQDPFLSLEDLQSKDYTNEPIAEIEKILESPKFLSFCLQSTVETWTVDRLENALDRQKEYLKIFKIFSALSADQIKDKEPNFCSIDDYVGKKLHFLTDFMRITEKMSEISRKALEFPTSNAELFSNIVTVRT